MKKYLKQILALAIVVTLVFSLGATAFAAEFTDMPAANHWAYNALNAAVTNNLLNGDNNGKLNPEGSLKRAEMAAIINRAFGAVQASDISKFADVSKDAWYYSDIAKAVQMGTFTGYDTGIMKPESQITRQEAFVVLARAIKLTDGNTSILDKYLDKALISDWAKGALAALVSAGYVTGADGKLNPTGDITRQEFAQVVYNTVKSYISTAGTVTSVADGNVMVNVAGVTLKNLTVKGDLIVGDGVANGDFILDNVKIEGRLVVRGGGKNSIKIINHSSVGDIVISKTSDGSVRVVADSTSSVEVVYVDDGKDGIIVEGVVTTLTIAGTIDVEIKGTIKNVILTEEAKGAEISVAAGSIVEKLESNASDIIVGGEGKITAATVNGDNTAINVVGTIVAVAKDVIGTTTNGTTVEGGKEVVVENPTPTGGGGGGGGVTTYEKEIDTLIESYVAILNASATSNAFATQVFLKDSNNCTCTIKHNLTVSQAYTAISDQFTAHSIYVDAAKIQAIEYISAIKINSVALPVDSSISLLKIKEFLLANLPISESAELNTSRSFTIIVTDTLGNNITYAFTIVPTT